MSLRQQTIAGATAGCSGCGQPIDCARPHLYLYLDNADGTLTHADLGVAHFHNQHCVSLMLAHAESIVGFQPDAMVSDGSLPPMPHLWQAACQMGT